MNVPVLEHELKREHDTSTCIVTNIVDFSPLPRLPMQHYFVLAVLVQAPI